MLGERRGQRRLAPRRDVALPARTASAATPGACLPRLAGLAVDHRHRLPGVVDEQLLAGAVLLAHHQVELRFPGPPGGSPCAPATTTTASRSCAATPGGPRSSPAADAPCGSAAAPETAGAPGRYRRPTPAGANPAPPPSRGAGSRPPSTARPQAAGDGSDAQRRGEVQPQHLSNLAHGQPSVRQRSPLLQYKQEDLTCRRVVPRRSAPTEGDRFGPESVIGLGRSTHAHYEKRNDEGRPRGPAGRRQSSRAGRPPAPSPRRGGRSRSGPPAGGTRRTRADDADSPVDDIDGRPGHWRVRKRFLPAGDEVRLPCVNAGGVPAAAVGECATPRYDENVDTSSQSAVPHMLTASTSRDCARAWCPVPLT